LEDALAFFWTTTFAYEVIDYFCQLGNQQQFLVWTALKMTTENSQGRNLRVCVVVGGTFSTNRGSRFG